MHGPAKTKWLEKRKDFKHKVAMRKVAADQIIFVFTISISGCSFQDQLHACCASVAVFLLCPFLKYYLLRENKVDVKILLTMSRSDLKDLFPTEFLSHKRLWDFISSEHEATHEG